MEDSVLPGSHPTGACRRRRRRYLEYSIQVSSQHSFHQTNKTLTSTQQTQISQAQPYRPASPSRRDRIPTVQHGQSAGDNSLGPLASTQDYCRPPSGASFCYSTKISGRNFVTSSLHPTQPPAKVPGRSFVCYVCSRTE